MTRRDPVAEAFDRVNAALGSDAAHAVYDLIRAVMDDHEDEFHPESSEPQEGK